MNLDYSNYTEKKLLICQHGFEVEIIKIPKTLDSFACSGINFKFIYSFNDKIEHVSITKSNMNSIENLGLQNTNILFLDLSQNNINEINQDSLPKTLVMLDLSHNKIDLFPDLSELTNCAFLDVRYNNLKEESIDGSKLPPNLKILKR